MQISSQRPPLRSHQPEGSVLQASFEGTAFCLRRIETVQDADCRVCYEGHEQLQASYLCRSRCIKHHLVELADVIPSRTEP